MDYILWINKAISQSGRLSLGSEFLLKDLYLGTEWNKLTSGERRELGRRFKFEVIRGRVPNVHFIGKANNNSTQYKKY